MKAHKSSVNLGRFFLKCSSGHLPECVMANDKKKTVISLEILAVFYASYSVILPSGLVTCMYHRSKVQDFVKYCLTTSPSVKLIRYNTSH